jgi:hypothetical protein
LLKRVAGWPDRLSIGYPAMSQPLAFPDQVPLLSARMLAVCVQAGGHPLAYPNLAQLMPGRDTESSTIASSLNNLVVVPIETLQALGIDVLADERFDTWIIMEM